MDPYISMNFLLIAKTLPPIDTLWFPTKPRFSLIPPWPPRKPCLLLKLSAYHRESCLSWILSAHRGNLVSHWYPLATTETLSLIDTLDTLSPPRKPCLLLILSAYHRGNPVSHWYSMPFDETPSLIDTPWPARKPCLSLKNSLPATETLSVIETLCLTTWTLTLIETLCLPPWILSLMDTLCPPRKPCLSLKLSAFRLNPVSHWYSLPFDETPSLIDTLCLPTKPFLSMIPPGHHGNPVSHWNSLPCLSKEKGE